MFENFPLEITDEMLKRLRALLEEDKFGDLPGIDTGAEKARCSAFVNSVVTRITAGIKSNPRKSWVLEQFLPELALARVEDTEARERIGAYFERMMEILGIDSSEGMLSNYL